MEDMAEIALLVAVIGGAVLFASFRNLSRDNWVTIGSAVFSVIFVILGWWFINYNDRRSRERIIREDYLISAFDDLALSSNRCSDQKHNELIEKTVANIQLLGQKQEIKALQNFISDWNRNQGRKANLDGLMNLIRDTVRAELGLEPVRENITWLRVTGGIIDPKDCQ